MRVLDQKGREHYIAYLDISSLDWEKIEVGAKIELTLEESIVETRVLAKAKV